MISYEGLLQTLRDEKSIRMPGGLYHELQVRMTYNSNHIEGSKLSEDQTRMIFETNTVDVSDGIPVDDIIRFHYEFERIHPFQDGNGRVGRLIMFKECLKYNIVPFIIEDNLKMFYYRGLKEWDEEKGYLMDTCLTAQDQYKAYLDYFRIEY